MLLERMLHKERQITRFPPVTNAQIDCWTITSLMLSFNKFPTIIGISRECPASKISLNITTIVVTCKMMTVQTTDVKESIDNSEKCYRQTLWHYIIPHIILYNKHHDITNVLLWIKKLICCRTFIHTHIAPKVTSILHIHPTAHTFTIITDINNVLKDPRRLQIRISNLPFTAIFSDFCIAHHSVWRHTTIGFKAVTCI